MSLTSRLFFFSLCVAISTFSSDTLSAQETDPVPLSGSGKPVPTGLSIVYDPGTGDVSASAPITTDLTALQLLSQGSLFTGQCDNTSGAFDVCDPDEVFKLETDGFATVGFGPILLPNIGGDTLVKDLLVNGASVGGGFDVGSGTYLVHPDFVPEPSSGFIFACGLFCIVASLCGRVRF